MWFLMQCVRDNKPSRTSSKPEAQHSVGNTNLLHPRVPLVPSPQEGKSLHGFKVKNQGRRKSAVLAVQDYHQGSPWESVQFSRFICDLEKGVSYELPKFADGLKLFLLVRSRKPAVKTCRSGYQKFKGY